MRSFQLHESKDKKIETWSFIALSFDNSTIAGRGRKKEKGCAIRAENLTPKHVMIITPAMTYGAQNEC